MTIYRIIMTICRIIMTIYRIIILLISDIYLCDSITSIIFYTNSTVIFIYLIINLLYFLKSDKVIKVIITKVRGKIYIK